MENAEIKPRPEVETKLGVNLQFLAPYHSLLLPLVAVVLAEYCGYSGSSRMRENPSAVSRSSVVGIDGWP